MNYKHLSAFAAVVPLCLLAGGVAFAQTSAQTQRNHPNRANAMPPPVDSTGIGVGMTNDFGSMGGSKGYVTRVQARTDAWLNENFATCDSNGDRKVDRAEYTACRNPQSAQQGRQSSRDRRHPDSHATTEAFDRISGTTGYVTEEQLNGVAWLRRHFDQCDDNGDGKLNRAEYGQCHKQHSAQASSMHSGSTSQQGQSWQQQSSQQPQTQQQSSSAYPQASQQQSSSDSESNQQQSLDKSNARRNQSSASRMNSSDTQSGDTDTQDNFDQLAGNKGFVTASQAAADPWMKRHFAQCDSNADGKLSRTEYDACTRR